MKIYIDCTLTALALSLSIIFFSAFIDHIFNITIYLLPFPFPCLGIEICPILLLSPHISKSFKATLSHFLQSIIPTGTCKQK